LSSVEKLTSMDATMTQLRAENAGMASMQATSLIGHTVTVKADHFVVPLAGNATSQFMLGGAAKTVSISVLDATGTQVRTLELGPQAAGSQTVSWDGTNDQGMRMPQGRYDYRVTAKSDTGQPVVADTEVSGVVSQLSFKNGTAALIVGGAEVSLTDVVSIAQ
jgi:flagellar basal-body rod modification protein FlgD